MEKGNVSKLMLSWNGHSRGDCCWLQCWQQYCQLMTEGTCVPCIVPPPPPATCSPLSASQGPGTSPNFNYSTMKCAECTWKMHESCFPLAVNPLRAHRMTTGLRWLHLEGLTIASTRQRREERREGETTSPRRAFVADCGG